VTLDADVAVLTANLPGHGVGGTDWFTLQACRRRITALVTLARKLSDAPVIVLGQSLGAALVLDAWASQVSFDAAIAISAPISVHVGLGLVRELGALTNKATWSTLRYGTLAEVIPAAGSFRRREFPVRVDGGASYVDAVARAVTEMALVERLQLASARRIAPPVLLVHGRSDGVVPFAQAETIAQALGHHQTPLFRDGIHHLDPLFDEPTLAAIRAWMTSRTKLARPH
jgi:alpha-beta hydrolase superfamily lysophospholipase